MALSDYQGFLDNAYTEYQKWDSYDHGLDLKTNGASGDTVVSTTSTLSFWQTFTQKYGFKNVIKSSGNAGKIVGLVDSALSATSWNQWASIGLSDWQTMQMCVYIGRGIG